MAPWDHARPERPHEPIPSGPEVNSGANFTERFSSAGSHAAAMLVVQLLDAVRVVARQLKGVRSITIVYGAGNTLKMTVRPSHSKTGGAHTLDEPLASAMITSAAFSPIM